MPPKVGQRAFPRCRRWRHNSMISPNGTVALPFQGDGWTHNGGARCSLQDESVAADDSDLTGVQLPHRFYLCRLSDAAAGDNQEGAVAEANSRGGKRQPSGINASDVGWQIRSDSPSALYEIPCPSQAAKSSSVTRMASGGQCRAACRARGEHSLPFPESGRPRLCSSLRVPQCYYITD